MKRALILTGVAAFLAGGCNLPRHDEHRHVTERRGTPARPKPSVSYHVDEPGNRLPVGHPPQSPTVK